MAKFEKGVSGNPGGRALPSPDVRALGKSMTADMMRALYSIATDEAQRASDRVAAATQVLDRAWGKPSQQIDILAHEYTMLGGLTSVEVKELVPKAIALLAEAEKEGGDE